MARSLPPRWFRVAILLASVLPARTAAAQAPMAPEPAPAPTGAAGSRLTIASDSACPSGPAVAEALTLLSPPSQWPSGSVRIQAAGETLWVELVADGATQRRLRVADDCGTRATTVALVIATWTGELASDAALAPVLRGERPRSETAPPPPPPPAVETPPIVAGSNDRTLGAGLLLALPDGVVPGVRIDFVQTRAPQGLGWQIGLALPARRERAAGGATARWTRAAANLTLNSRLTVRGLAVSVDAGLAGAYTATAGQGYAITQGSEALTAGLVAGARLALPWRRLYIWTEIRAYRWLFPQSVAVDAAGSRVATVALPSSDLHVAVGLAYRLR